MTVKELINLLKEYPDDMLTETLGDSCATFPNKRVFKFDYNYWDNSKIQSIPANQEHICLQYGNPNQ